MRNIFCLLMSMAMIIGLTAGMVHAQVEYPAVQIVDEVADSVVSINVNQVRFGGISGAGFVEGARYERIMTRRVTGFVYTENGYILTDVNGIQDAAIITVVLNDETEYEAEIVGEDEDYGVAVLKIEVDPDEPLVPAKILKQAYNAMDNVYPYDQGDLVLAIGNSGGFGGTVTHGIISAVRNFRNRNGILLPNMIQADVSINSGNEGCPLVNDKGQIIGFHDRGVTSGRGFLENVTFFLPMSVATRVADELIGNYENPNATEDFEVWHPWLGIKTYSGSTALSGQPRTVDPALKMYLNIPDQYWDVGVLLDNVWPESPAKEFGLQAMDMIMNVTVLDANENIKVDYMEIKEIEDLELLVTTAEKDDIFILGILRLGSSDITYLTLEVVIGQHPGTFAFLDAWMEISGVVRADQQLSNDYF